MQLRKFSIIEGLELFIECREPPGDPPADVSAPGPAIDTVGWDVWLGATRHLLEVISRNPCILARQGVLELGAGVGVVGLAAGALGASRVLLTDYDPIAVHLSERNAKANGLADVCCAQSFDWCQPEQTPVCLPSKLAPCRPHAPDPFLTTLLDHTSCLWTSLCDLELEVV